MQKPPPDNRPYRPGVGIVLFNSLGHIFVAERLDHPGSWQMPQGGIDEGEDPETAVFREMEEEIGTRNARILGMMEEWLHYEFPERTAAKLWDGKYRGQKQKWIALAFLGVDADIDLMAHTHPEFGRWKWMPMDDLLDAIVPFKRPVYAEVLRNFSPFARELIR